MWFKSSLEVTMVAAVCLSFAGGATPACTDLGDQRFKLLADDGAMQDLFGMSVAISGPNAIVGAGWDDNHNGPASGSVYLFNINTGHQIAKLLASDGAAVDMFGQAVAISGDTVLAGASSNDVKGINSGSAYLFDVSDPKNPVQIAKLVPKDGAAIDNFGYSVAISGTTTIVGAYLDDDDDNGADSGSAYLICTTPRK